MTSLIDTSATKQKKKKLRNSLIIVLALIAIVAIIILLKKSFFFDSNENSTTDHQQVKSDPTNLLNTLSSKTSKPLSSISTAQSEARATAEQNNLDPRTDGWRSEVDAELAKKHLSKLLKLATKNTQAEPLILQGHTNDFQCNSLRPRSLVEVYRDSTIRILEQVEQNSEEMYKGASGLAQALSQFGETLRDFDALNTHVKIIRVLTEAKTITTTAIIETGGSTSKKSIGQRAYWTCEWLRNGESLLLRSIRSYQYRETIGVGPEGVWFSDCTEAVLGKNPSFSDQLMYGFNHWLSRIERVNGIQVFARWGVAVGDVNNDGLDDIYVCQPGGLPNRLMIQQPNGTAIDQSAHAGVDWLDHTSSALLIDLDNNGTQDLVLATSSGIVVMENDKAGRFQWRATLPLSSSDVQSLSAIDYDNDGDLDLYICIDFAPHTMNRNEESAEFVYYDANDGGANVLFRNDLISEDKVWKFTDVTMEAGLDVNNRRHSLAASWEDYDNDGDQDLYVANDYGQNSLYRNDNGRFFDVAAKTGVLDYGSGMSVSWGDINRDGMMDLYVGNMFSSAGNRITRQSNFRSRDDQKIRSIYSRFAKGNSLFTGDESGTFQDVGATAGVEMGRWAWSSLLTDLNNDGWQDIFVANGYITTEDTGDL